MEEYTSFGLRPAALSLGKSKEQANPAYSDRDGPGDIFASADEIQRSLGRGVVLGGRFVLSRGEADHQGRQSEGCKQARRHEASP